ncbi:MAG: hypothetical protein H6718_07115 [Polyangiaceae bacterium]|nr:hypothetical protein [Myxococcales bacterium]MCB9585150.1 hypothetical protein [Polyangiaceae bacterium]
MSPARAAGWALCLICAGGCGGTPGTAVPPGNTPSSDPVQPAAPEPTSTPEPEPLESPPADPPKALLPAAPLDVVGIGSPQSFLRLENALVVFLATGNDDDVASPLLLHAGTAKRFDALLGGKEFDADTSRGLWGFEGRYPSDIYARISDSTKPETKSTAAHLVGKQWRPMATKLNLLRSPLWSPPGYKKQPAPSAVRSECDYELTDVLWSEQLVIKVQGAPPKVPVGPRASIGKRCSDESEASNGPFAIELWAKAGAKSQIQELPVPAGSAPIGGGMAGSTLVFGYRNGDDAEIFYWDTEAQRKVDIPDVPKGISSLCSVRGGELWAAGSGSLWNYSAGKWIELRLPDFAGATTRPEQVACLGEDIAVIARAGESKLFEVATGLVFWSGKHQGVMRAGFLDELPEGVEEMK